MTKQYIFRKNTEILNEVLTELKEDNPKEIHQFLSELRELKY